VYLIFLFFSNCVETFELCLIDVDLAELKTAVVVCSIGVSLPGAPLGWIVTVLKFGLRPRTLDKVTMNWREAGERRRRTVCDSRIC
jgi:hypothetical protein